VSKITKGNWTVYKGCHHSCNQNAHTVIESDDSDLYIEVEGGTDADVKAIYAIPELVKAIKVMYDLQCNLPEWWFREGPDGEPSPSEIINKAISKLQGD